MTADPATPFFPHSDGISCSGRTISFGLQNPKFTTQDAICAARNSSILPLPRCLSISAPKIAGVMP